MNIRNTLNVSSHRLILALFCLVWALSFSTVKASQFSALGVSPTRIVIGAQQKSDSITITNNSKTEVTYRMKLLEMGRDSQGRFRRLSNNELPTSHQSAVKLIKFSPRQVQLKPGQSQVIRVIARRPRNLAPGEYRSHLQIAALPIISDQSLADLIDRDRQAVLVQAKSGTNVGISMPVILRHGQTNANVRLKTVHLNADKKGKIVNATVDLGLDGNQSTYGHIKLQLEYNGKWQDIGQIRGFALYHPYPGDRVRVPVNSPISARQLTSDSKVRVVFENPAATSDSESVWLDGTVVPQIRTIRQ